MFGLMKSEFNRTNNQTGEKSVQSLNISAIFQHNLLPQRRKRNPNSIHFLYRGVSKHLLIISVLRYSSARPKGTGVKFPSEFMWPGPLNVASHCPVPHPQARFEYHIISVYWRVDEFFSFLFYPGSPGVSAIPSHAAPPTQPQQSHDGTSRTGKTETLTLHPSCTGRGGGLSGWWSSAPGWDE